MGLGFSVRLILKLYDRAPSAAPTIRFARVTLGVGER